MKLHLLVLTLATVTFAKVQYDKKKFDQLTQECGRELSIRPEDVDLVLKELIGGPQLHNCLLKCLMRKIGFIDENGHVQLGNYHDIIPQDDPIRETMVECQHIVVETCDDALTLGKCNDSVLRRKLGH